MPSNAAAIRLIPDRTRIAADGSDVAVVSVQVLDAQGRIVPTADNTVSFEIDGPGRIIGVGNGDPVSHEPDQFLETLGVVPIEDWRGRIAPAGTAAPAAPEALAPFAQLGNWLAPLPKPGEVYDLAGTFPIANAVPAEAKLTLFVPSLGAKTTVWLNGRELTRDADTTSAGLPLTLNASQLNVGLNRMQLLVTPVFDKRNHIPELGQPGAFQIRTPAPTWQRSVFNGYAQIIVQAGTQPGAIRLTARSKDLSPATVTETTEQTTPHPAVP